MLVLGIGIVMMLLFVIAPVTAYATTEEEEEEEEEQNPLESLPTGTKSEEQRKQEIYNIVEDYSNGLVEKNSYWPPSVSKVDLVNSIYQEELMKGEEYNEIQLNFEIFSAIIGMRK